MTATPSYALTTDYNLDSGNVPLSTYETNVSVFIHLSLNATGTLKMDPKSSLILNSKVFHQLSWCWGTVLAGDENIYLCNIS